LNELILQVFARIVHWCL